MMRVHTVTVTSCYTVYATYQYGHLNYIIIYWSTGHWATTAARMAPGQFPLGIRLVRCQGHGPYQNSLKILSISCQIKKTLKGGVENLNWYVVAKFWTP